MSRNLDGCIEDTDTLFAKRLREELPMLTENDIVVICEIIGDVCRHCWDSDRGCQCWNDE